MIDQNQQLFSTFNLTNDRIVTLSETKGSSDDYGDIWELVKMFLILFHVQSEVVRGFSINKHFLVENSKQNLWLRMGEFNIK